MKGLEMGSEKIQKICDALRKETLDPAKQEAREIVENAHVQAAEIIEVAKAKAAHLLESVEKEIEEKKKVFQASLNLACRQGLESLKQKIEQDLFRQELFSLVDREMKEPKLVAHIINKFLESLEKKGLEEEFVAAIPKEVSPREINELLAAKVLDRLQGKTVVAGDFNGGVQLHLKDRKITVDVSDAVVKELIGQYIRRDLRDLVFGV
jgi:V/A-type H+-transporting ATPase subunit E